MRQEDAEGLMACSLWLIQRLEERLHDPTVIEPKAVSNAAFMIHSYMKQHGDTDRSYGFQDGVLLTLIMTQTSPTNVKGVRDGRPN